MHTRLKFRLQCSISGISGHTYEAAYILPHMLGSEAPKNSTLKPKLGVQTPSPSNKPRKNDHSHVTQQILEVLPSLQGNSNSYLSTDISNLRWKVMQLERVQNRQQTILVSLSNLANRKYQPMNIL